MATENKEQFTVNGNVLTMNKVTDTTLLKHVDKIIELVPGTTVEEYKDKDGNKKTKLVFPASTVDIPEELVKASKKRIDSISSFDEEKKEWKNERSVYSLAMDSFKVLARANFLDDVKEALGLPKGVSGVSPEARGKRKYVQQGGTFNDAGEPNNDASMFGMTNISLQSFIDYEKGIKQ